MFLIIKLCSLTNQLESNLIYKLNDDRSKTFKEIQDCADLLKPLNSSTSSLARALSSSLNGTEITFSIVETKVKFLKIF